MTEAHDIKRHIMPLPKYLSIIIIDPHVILLMCVCVGSSILVARMCDNCHAHCCCSVFVMNIRLILIAPKVVIVALVIVVQNNSNDGILNWCKACNTANFHTL